MPDANGIMTPQEIADQGVNALYKVSELKRQDVLEKQKDALFKQQLASGEMQAQLDHLKLDMNQTSTKLLNSLALGTDEKGQPLPPYELQRRQRLLSFFPGYQGPGAGVAPTPVEQLPPEVQPFGKAVAADILPTGNVQAQVNVTARGQDTAATTAAADLAGRADEINKRFLLDVRSAGGNLFAPSAANLKLDTPEGMDLAFKGVVPSVRMHAEAAMISAHAQELTAMANDAVNKAEAQRYTADAKNKWAGIRTLGTILAQNNAALNGTINAGGTDEQKSLALDAVIRTATALAGEMRSMGLDLPPATEPKQGWWQGWFSKRKPAAGSIDIEKAKAALASGNLDQNVTSDASPASGADLPPAATPTPTPTSAAPAPISSLPLTDSNGNSVPYLSPADTALAIVQARQNAVNADAGHTLPILPGMPVNTTHTDTAEIAKRATRDRLLKSVQLYLTIPSMYDNLVRSLAPLPIDEQIRRLEVGLATFRKLPR